MNLPENVYVIGYISCSRVYTIPAPAQGCTQLAIDYYMPRFLFCIVELAPHKVCCHQHVEVHEHEGSARTCGSIQPEVVELAVAKSTQQVGAGLLKVCHQHGPRNNLRRQVLTSVTTEVKLRGSMKHGE